MSLSTIEIQAQGAASWVWLNRPEVHNAFDETVIQELTEALLRIDEDADSRAIVIAGRGKSFSAGGDLNWMKRQGQASMEQNLADARKMAELFRVMSECGKPTIARVHGAAMGGGLGIAAACDICVASTQAIFATSEVRLGLLPGVISPYVIRAIGERQAYRYFQTAERITAQRAHQIGLVHEVATPEELDQAVQKIIDALMLGGPASQKASTELIRAVANRPLDAAVIEECAKRIATLRAGDEAKEGLTAFLEKRAPNWGGS